MLKVYFLNGYMGTDQTVINRLREEMIKLAETDTHIEFWFLGTHGEFYKKAIQFIGELKAVLRRSQIEIILVEDPLKEELFDESVRKMRGIESDLISRYEMAPRLEGKEKVKESRYIEHFRKVERWVMDQCDIVLAYHYDNIPHPANREINRLRKKEKPKVISIYSPDFYEKIEECIAGMDDREGYVLKSIREGKTYREIGEELGVSSNRVQQIVNKAIRNINNYIRNEDE